MKSHPQELKQCSSVSIHQWGESTSKEFQFRILGIPNSEFSKTTQPTQHWHNWRITPEY